MALEVVTGRKHDKTEKNDTTREHGTGHVFCFVCCLQQRRIKYETIFHSSRFVFLKIMQSKQTQIWNYYRLSSEDQNKKTSYLDWQETDNIDTGRSW